MENFTMKLISAALFGALMAALLCGCDGVGVQVPGDGEYVVVDYDLSFDSHTFPGTPYSEAEAVRAGVKFWNQLGARIVFPEEISRDISLYAFHYQIARDDFSWPGETTTGVTYPGTSTSRIYPNSMKEQDMYDFVDFRTVVAHEMGHALGLYHVYDGVMSPTSGWPATYPSTQDRAEYCRVWPKSKGCVQ